MFTVAVRTIEERTEERLERLFALAGAVPEARRGLISAFGWLDPEHLQGIVASLLGSPDAFRRLIGIGACATHRVAPGLVSARRILDTDPRIRARALRTAGEIGCEESAPACAAALRDDDAECRFWAAWSSVLLGNRGVALEKLTETALTAGPHRPLAFGLVLQAMSPAAAHRFLKGLAAAPRDLRALIRVPRHRRRPDLRFPG